MPSYYAVVHRKRITDDPVFVAIGAFVVDLPGRDVIFGYNDKYPEERDHMVDIFSRLSEEQWEYDCCLDYWKSQGGYRESYTEPQEIEAACLEEAARIITERVHGEYRAYWDGLKEELIRDGFLVYNEAEQQGV